MKKIIYTLQIDDVKTTIGIRAEQYETLKEAINAFYEACYRAKLEKNNKYHIYILKDTYNYLSDDPDDYEIINSEEYKKYDFKN